MMIGFVPLGDKNEVEKLTELFNTTSSTSTPNPTAMQEFGHRYQDYTLQIKKDFTGIISRFGISDTPTKCIQIIDVDLAMSVLQHYGSVIKKLHIGVDFAKNILERFSTPFEAVEDLNIHLNISTNETVSNIAPFGQLFPRLTRLQLSLESDVDYGFLDCKIQQLQQLDITVTDDSWKRRDQIDAFFRKNTQIKSLEISGFSLDYVKIISELVPNIENLTIPGFTANDIVRFEHVTHLAYGKYLFDDASPGSIEKLLLPKLESIEFYYWPDSLKVWREFFKNHQHLQKLNFRLGITQNFETPNGDIQFVQLTSDLLDLIDITMPYSKSVNVENVHTFVRNHPKLLNVKFKDYSVNSPGIDIASFRERLGSEWNVKDGFIPPEIGCYPQYEVTLQRKNTEALLKTDL